MNEQQFWHLSGYADLRHLSGYADLSEPEKGGEKNFSLGQKHGIYLFKQFEKYLSSIDGIGLQSLTLLLFPITILFQLWACLILVIF